VSIVTRGRKTWRGKWSGSRVLGRYYQLLAVPLALGCGFLLSGWSAADDTVGPVRPVTSASPADRIEYNRDIRPILSENCFACHGYDDQTREAGLRLDMEAAAHESAIVPGDREASELWLRITSDQDSGIQMPPPESHLSLGPQQIDLLGQWIDQGAVYADHWSFVPPARSPLPEPGAGEDWGSDHPIDAFVRHRLQQEGLAPAAEADRYTLIRRLSLNLLGLPPSADQVRAFVDDPDPQAYERLVEQLLASPHFGERLALEWMDAARYADTNGFSIDGGRHQWLWRDWVIQAFNDNLPYDRFLVEQLAGDLLPDPTPAQRIATGFQRNNMVTHEGGTIPEENLANYNADRVKTLGEAVLGLTLGCAQCHNHKFDPISQREYYQLVDFFNSLGDQGLAGDGGVNPGPSIQAHTVIRGEDPESLRQRIEQLRRVLDEPDPQILADWEAQQQAVLESRGQDFQLHPVQVLNLTTPNRGGGFRISDSNEVRLDLGGGLAAYDMSLQLPDNGEPVRGLRVVFQPVDQAPAGGWGGGRRTLVTDEGSQEKGTFVLTAITVTADQVPSDQVNLHQMAELSELTASSWDAEFPPAAVRDPRNHNGWSPRLSDSGAVHFTAAFDQPVMAEQTPYLTVQLNFGHGQSLIPGHFQLFVYTGVNDDYHLPPEIVTLIQTPPDQRSPADLEHLWRYCAADCDQLRRQRIELANLEERLRVLTEAFPVMVMSVAQQPRETFVLHRGDYSQPRDKVTAGVPAALPPLPNDRPADRLALAQWLTDPGHPLTARVAVNRMWQMLFGRGIVATSADFGSQGQWPSHPELLDWLAVEFQESGWDVKGLIRLIVTSQTYRQSSASTAQALAGDPDNEWLGRGPRFRLPAEFVRDAALQISGLMVPRLGGPSVNPYTPGDPWREVSHYGSTPATAQTFVQDQGEKLYRRSLYTYWKRTAPPPNLTAFDAPNREVCVVSRPLTTTPLQSLVLLNDVQFVEASRAFAQRILERADHDRQRTLEQAEHDRRGTVEGPDDDRHGTLEGSVDDRRGTLEGADVDRQRIEWAMLETVGRPAEDWELDRLLELLARQRQHYRQESAAAKALLSHGQSPRDPRWSADEHAAWTMLASLLLNLSETITSQ